MLGYVYVLIDPRTDKIRYVGQTLNLEKRLREHLRLPPTDQSARAFWLRDLLEAKLLPRMVSVGTAATPEDLNALETAVIVAFRAKGFDLTNAHNGTWTLMTAGARVGPFFGLNDQPTRDALTLGIPGYQAPERKVFTREQFEAAAEQVINSFRSKYTRSAYKSDLRRWLAFCDTRDIQPSSASLEAATAFRDALLTTTRRAGRCADKGLAAVTVRRTLAALASIYARLRRLSYGIGVTTEPFHAKALTWPPAPEEGTTTLIPEGSGEQMIAAATNLRDVAILRLLYDTGMRRSSVASLSREGLLQDRNGGMSASLTVKGARAVRAILPPLTADALRAWLAVAPESPWVFPGRDLQYAIDPSVVNRCVALVARQVGVKAHPHCFRATFVTDGYDANLSERSLQGAVHHKHSATTQRYDRKARGGTVANDIMTFREQRAREQGPPPSQPQPQSLRSEPQARKPPPESVRRTMTTARAELQARLERKRQP